MQRWILPLAAAAAGLALAGCGSGNESSGGGAGTDASQTFTVKETEFALSPSNITIDEPGTYTFEAVNDGKIPHALEVEGSGVEAKTDAIEPGSSARFTVELKESGDYEMYCPIGNHRAQGMDGSVDVGGSSMGGGDSGTTSTTETGDDGGGYGY